MNELLVRAAGGYGTGKWQKKGRTKRKSAFFAGAKAARRQQVELFRGGVSDRELAAMEVPHGYPAGAINAEFKCLDVGPGAMLEDTTGAVLLLNACQTGAALNQRIGRQIMMRSVELKVDHYVTAGSGLDQVQRLVLVYDRQCNGVAPAIGDIIGATGVYGYMSMRNLDNRHRFKILMDKFITLNASVEPGSRVAYTFYRKLRHPVQFNVGNGGTIADISSGAMYCITVSSNVPGVTAGGVDLASRIRFTDN